MKKDIFSIIDCGSNSFHLYIMRKINNNFEIIDREREVVRIGKSNQDGSIVLTAEGISKAIKVLEYYYSKIKLYNADVFIAATSAIREAVNKNELLEKVENALGLKINIISEEDEAKYIFKGVCRNLKLKDKKILHIEIGGGSTEIASGMNCILYSSACLRIGAVKLFHLFFEDKKVSGERISECQRYIRNLFDENFSKFEINSFDVFTGSAGTIQAITRINQTFKNTSNFLNLTFNNINLDKKFIDELYSYFIQIKSIDEIKSLKGVPPDRTDIILPGFLILYEYFKYFEIPELIVSSTSFREGLIYSLIDGELD